MLQGRWVEFPDLNWFAGVLEFFGGPLIALGLWTRPVAFILSGEMAVAFWRGSLPIDPTFLRIEESRERAVLFCFIFLFLVAAIRRKRSDSDKLPPELSK